MKKQKRQSNPGKKRVYLKFNPAVGGYTGLIYALSLSLHVGYGSADNEHFEVLFARSLQNCNFDLLLCDKGYYDEENYALCQAHNKMLFVLPKGNSKADVATTEQLAFVAWLVKECPAVFRRFYRRRVMVEGTFSQKKRKNGHIKLRRRRKEMERFKKLSYPFDMSKRMTKDQRRVRTVLNRIIAWERVGVAQRNEALCKAVASNLRRLRFLEKIHRDQISLNADKALTPIRHVSPPPFRHHRKE